jgi:hypothetical protein
MKGNGACQTLFYNHKKEFSMKKKWQAISMIAFITVAAASLREALLADFSKNRYVMPQNKI